MVGEDAENFSLMIVELHRRGSAEGGQIVVKECLYTCQAEMRQARTIIEQSGDTLSMLVI